MHLLYCYSFVVIFISFFGGRVAHFQWYCFSFIAIRILVWACWSKFEVRRRKGCLSSSGSVTNWRQRIMEKRTPFSVLSIYREVRCIWHSNLDGKGPRGTGLLIPSPWYCLPTAAVLRFSARFRYYSWKTERMWQDHASFNTSVIQYIQQHDLLDFNTWRTHDKVDSLH